MRVSVCVLVGVVGALVCCGVRLKSMAGVCVCVYACGGLCDAGASTGCWCVCWGDTGRVCACVILVCACVRGACAFVCIHAMGCVMLL